MEKPHGQRQPNAVSPLAEGTSLHRRYSVREPLSAHHGTLLYDGFDYVAGQPVAILEYFPSGVAVRAEGETAVSPGGRENGELYFVGMDAFYRQYGKLTETIGSPNVLSIFDVFFENGTAYAITEQPEGIPLSAYLAARGRGLSDGELTYIVRALADALLVVHSCNTLHYGISEDSILLCTDGTVKLIAFAAGDRTVRLRRAVKDDEPWNDIRALGETLYRAYTGMEPVAMAHLDETLPHAFISLFTGMLSERASLRFSSVFDLRYTTESLPVAPARPDVTPRNLQAYRDAADRMPAPKENAPETPSFSAEGNASSHRPFPWVAVAVGAILLLLLGLLLWALLRW